MSLPYEFTADSLKEHTLDFLEELEAELEKAKQKIRYMNAIKFSEARQNVDAINKALKNLQESGFVFYNSNTDDSYGVLEMSVDLHYKTKNDQYYIDCEFSQWIDCGE